jgi:hypothetical protein
MFVCAPKRPASCCGRSWSWRRERQWGFLGRGGAYLFYTHVYHGVSRLAIGKMIASLRPITQLSPRPSGL